MTSFSRMQQLFNNWLEVVADQAADDVYDGTPQSYDEFTEYAVTALEDMLMDEFYDFYMTEYNS